MSFKHFLFMSVLYVCALFSSYKPLKFGNSYYPGVFLCGVYCISFENKVLNSERKSFPSRSCYLMERSFFFIYLIAARDQLEHFHNEFGTVFFTSNVSKLIGFLICYSCKYL